jgi:tetratricopeptide (TPR) repeat protein
MEYVENKLQAASLLAEEKYAEAIALYEQCIDDAPDGMSNYWELGLALLLSGEELEAQAVWLQVMAQGNSEEIEEWTVELIKVLEASGLQHLQAGKYQQAERIYCQILELEPNNSEAYKNLGDILLNQGKLEEAIAHYQQAVSLNPQDANSYFNLGLVFQIQALFEEAIAYYQQFLTLNSNNISNEAKAYFNLGYAFQMQGLLEEAICYYKQASNLEPNDATTHFNLGYVFQMQGNLDPAIACYQQALTLDPNYREVHYNLSTVFLHKNELEKATVCASRAIELNPDYAEAHWNRGLILLKGGDYERGFIEYEWRWVAQKLPPRSFPQPVWDGKDLAGRTILLHQSEQGFGDTIQFIRYANLVQQRGGHVVVECQESLVRLLKSVSGISNVIAIGTKLPEFDVQAPLMSLPYIFGTTLETIPAQIPYINHDPSLSLKLESSSSMKVGLVWAGNPENPNDRNRSCSLSDFLGILNTPGISFYSLQKGLSVVQIAELSEKVPLQDLSSQLHDFADTAAVVAQLDLIITVDTAVAHLAGALGRPVWVVISFIHDWRWLLEREDSPWYPSMRLFRQQQLGDWTEVLGRVQAALLKLTGADFNA